jgi:hypothetical protein
MFVIGQIILGKPSLYVHLNEDEEEGLVVKFIFTANYIYYDLGFERAEFPFYSVRFHLKRKPSYTKRLNNQ